MLYDPHVGAAVVSEERGLGVLVVIRGMDICTGVGILDV